MGMVHTALGAWHRCVWSGSSLSKDLRPIRRALTSTDLNVPNSSIRCMSGHCITLGIHHGALYRGRTWFCFTSLFHFNDKFYIGGDVNWPFFGSGTVGTLKDGYTKSSPLPRVNPIKVNRSRIPLAKLGRAITASTWHQAVHAWVHT